MGSTYIVNFVPMDGTSENAMAEHAEAHERQSNVLGEEDLAYRGWDLGEGIPHAPDDKVLKERGSLYKRRSVRARCEISLIHELYGHEKDC